MANENDNDSNVTDITTKILAQIRDDVRQVRDEARETRNEVNARLDQHSAALEQQWTALEQQGAALEQQGAALEQQKAALEQQGAALDQQGTALDQQGTALGELAREMKAGFERHDAATTKLTREVNGLSSRVDNVLLGVHREQHEDIRRRLDALEKRTG